MVGYVNAVPVFIFSASNSQPKEQAVSVICLKLTFYDLIAFISSFID